MLTSQAFQVLQEKLLYIESQMEKLKQEKEFLNYFYIQSSIDDQITTITNLSSNNIDHFNNTDENLFVNSNNVYVKQEEELILYKTKYNELMKENRKMKLELSPNCRHIDKNKINKYLTIFISLLLILFAYFYNTS